MAGYNAYGLSPGTGGVGAPGETEEQRRRREAIEANAAAIDASDAAYQAQGPYQRPEPAVPAPIIDDTPDPMAVPKAPVGTVVPILDEGPGLNLKRPGTDAPVRPKAAPPPAAAPDPAVVTTRAGNVSVQTPLSPGADLSQTTSRGSKSVNQREVTKEEKAHQAEIATLEAKALERAEMIEKERTARANAIAAVEATKAAELALELKNHEIVVNRRIAVADQADKETKAAYAQAHRNPKERFWADKTTGEKVTAGISLLLGIVGGLTDGSNVGAERIEAALKADEARHRQIVDDKEKILERSRGDVTATLAQLRSKKELIDWKYGSIRESIIADADARARRLGISEEDLLKNPGRQAVLDAAAARKQKYLESIAPTVQREQAWSKMSTSADGGGPGGGVDKPPQKWNGEEKKAEGFAQRMAAAHGDMSKFQYSPSDVRAIQTAVLQEQIAPKGLNAGINFIRGDVFKRLSPEGKKRFLAEQEFARANLRRESGAAIGLQEQQSEIEQVGERPGETPETRAMKQQQRLLKVRAVGISSGRPSYWEQQTGQMAQATAPQAPQPNPQADEAKEWLAKNPTHPKAAAVAAKLRTMGAM